jgi:hypothetical protein
VKPRRRLGGGSRCRVIKDGTAVAVRPGGACTAVGETAGWSNLVKQGTRRDWKATIGPEHGRLTGARVGDVKSLRLQRILAKPPCLGDRTRIMPQTRASDVQAPAQATPAPASAAAAQIPEVPAAPISIEQAEFLRARRDALSSQLGSVQNRRDEVAEALRDDDTQSAERPGLEQRLQVLDKRLIQIESEIAVNSEQLANAPARQGAESRVAATVAGRGGAEGFLSRANPNAVVFFSFMLLMPVVLRLARRFLAPARGPSRQEAAELAALKERMEKMDGAIDAVALEVERIGEGQRFLTQAMSENLRVSAQKVPAYEPVPLREREASELR